LTEIAQVVAGGETYEASPAADGEDRLMEVTSALAPVVEEIGFDKCYGFTTRPRPVLDLAAI
jgi:hypothetical protein